MKSKYLIVALFLLNFSLIAQEFKSPVDYLNYINKEQTAISRSTWKYTSAVAHSKSARKIDNTRKQLIKSIQTAKKKISALNKGYNSDMEYQNQIIQYFDFCEKNLLSYSFNYLLLYPYKLRVLPKSFLKLGYQK